MVEVLELLDAGTPHCGGSSVGTAVEVEVNVVEVEVEVDGARITVLNYNSFKERTGSFKIIDVF